MRCSIDPDEDVILWWSGTMFAHLPGKAPAPILGFEGYNICRSEQLEDGTWRIATRELTFYRDLETGEIVDQWDNPFTGGQNAVVHVANDPVNTVLYSPARAMPVPWVESGEQLMLTLNIPLSYPNPLQPDEYPAASSGETYVGSEHFTFFAPIDAMGDPALTQVPVTYGWTRLGPWLPWMGMGRAEGGLLYVGQGNKKASIDELASDIRERIHTTYPEYATAPREWKTPNATSWTEYRRLHPPQGSGPGGPEGKAGE